MFYMWYDQVFAALLKEPISQSLKMIKLLVPKRELRCRLWEIIGSPAKTEAHDAWVYLSPWGGKLAKRGIRLVTLDSESIE